jgi:regulator of protease activity HflC (stomatin/prohibitin superfamily)
MKRHVKKKHLVLMAVMALALTGCRANTQSNEVAVHVTGYDIFPTDAKVKDCINPSTNKYIGIGDDAYVYPAGQRSFTFDSKNGADFPPIAVVSKDNVTMTLSGTISFYLNTDCKTLMKFHQQIGSKNWNGHAAYVNGGNYDGWINMLDVELGKPLQNSLTDVANNFSYLDLYTKAEVRQTLEGTLAKTIESRVNDLTGGDYFNDFKVLLNKPAAPQNIVDALEAQAAAIQQNLAQRNLNATALTGYQQIVQCKRLGISEPECVLLFAINSGKITLVPYGSAAVVGSPPPSK